VPGGGGLRLVEDGDEIADAELAGVEAPTSNRSRRGLPARRKRAMLEPMSAPAWSRIAGLDDLEWSAGSEARQGPDWTRLQTAPRAGARVVLVSPRALPAGTFWALFCPPLSSANGWEEHPAELTGSAVVRCEVKVDLGRDDQGWQAAAAVLETVLLTDLADHFAPDRSGAVPPLPGRRTRFACGDVTVVGGNLEGDVSGELVFLPRDGGLALVLHRESVFRESGFVAGHRPLSAAESRSLTG